MNSTSLLLAIMPLVAVQLGLVTLALRDLADRDRRVRGGSKAAWAAVIVLGELVGPIAYLSLGRRDA